MAEKLQPKTDTASTSSSTIVWKCPVCRKIPKREIYQCPEGHSFCNGCTKDGKVCPICNVKISGYKLGSYGVRNYLAESLLNKMQFECQWKDHGCQALTARDQISVHENTCTYGPVYLCKRFPSTCLFGCQFQVYLYKSLNIDRILSHVRSAHETFLVKSGMEFGSVFSIDMDQAMRRRMSTQTTKNYIIPAFVDVVHFKNGNISEPSRELFMILRNVIYEPRNNVSIGWAFVWLTSEIKETDFTVKMKVTIKSKVRSSTSGQLEGDIVPDLNWTLEPIKATEFAEWVSSRDKKLEFPFSLPLSHINKHYVDNNDVFKISFTIFKEKY